MAPAGAGGAGGGASPQSPRPSLPWTTAATESSRAAGPRKAAGDGDVAEPAGREHMGGVGGGLLGRAVAVGRGDGDQLDVGLGRQGINARASSMPVSVSTTNRGIRASEAGPRERRSARWGNRALLGP